MIGSEDSPLVLKQNRRLGRHRASSLSMLPCKFGTGLAVSRGGHVTPHCGKKMQSKRGHPKLGDFRGLWHQLSGLSVTYITVR